MERARNATKLVDHNHTREVIFALPSMQLHLKTEHLQTADIPDASGIIYFVLFILVLKKPLL